MRTGVICGEFENLWSISRLRRRLPSPRTLLFVSDAPTPRGTQAHCLSCNFLLQMKAEANPQIGGGPGWGKAKSIILCYLQGGPSHLEMWDPKENVPDNVRSAFKSISTKVLGVQFTEILPKLAQVNDRLTMIRSMSYLPKRYCSTKVNACSAAG